MLFVDVRKVLLHLDHEYITLPDQENQKENNSLKLFKQKNTFHNYLLSKYKNLYILKYFHPTNPNFSQDIQKHK